MCYKRFFRGLFRRPRISLRVWLLVWSLALVAVGAGGRWLAFPVAFDGYCPVTLDDKQIWTEGKWYIASVRGGQRFLFADWERKREFDNNPVRYMPVQSGIDVVIYTREGREVPGKRETGLWYKGRVYLFANESTLQEFAVNPGHFAGRAVPVSSGNASP